MSEAEYTNYISLKTGTRPEDWILVKESTNKEFKQFRNKNNNETYIAYIDSINKMDTYENEYIPDSFLIVLPAGMSKNNIDLTKIYVNSDPMGFDGNDPDGIEVVFDNQQTEIPMDQHVGYFVQEFFGIKNFMKDFEEVCENSHMLVSNFTIEEVIEIFENKGLTFLGFEEYYDFH